MLVALAACGRSHSAASVSPDASITPSAESTVAMPTDDWPERYRGKPMLVVIENYALSVIGALSSDKEASIGQIVKQTFGGDDDWRSTVRRTMGWPSNVDARSAKLEGVQSGRPGARQARRSSGLRACVRGRVLQVLEMTDVRPSLTEMG